MSSRSPRASRSRPEKPAAADVGSSLLLTDLVCRHVGCGHGCNPVVHYFYTHPPPHRVKGRNSCSARVGYFLVPLWSVDQGLGE